VRIALTGATGLLGSNLAAALLAAGHTVRATRRARSRADHLAHLAIDWAEADLGDPGALTAAFRGCDAVVHCAAQVSITRAVTPALQAANVDGTRHVLTAVRAVGARLLHCSSVVAVGLSEDGQPCTEESRWNFAEHGLADGYAITKRQSQELVLAAAADGVDAVVVNPTYMLGPSDARPSSGRLIIDVVRRKLPGWTPGRNNFVDVRDVARGMIAALERGQRGRCYILGGENMTYGDIMQRIAAVAGVAPPRLRVPRALAAPIGWAGDLVERFAGREPLINSVTVGYGFCERFIFSSARAERELGYRSSPIEPAIGDAIAWFREHGML
jgi:dihydroflavonol-4-reductase